MLETADEEVRKLFMLELVLTFLGGIAWILETHVYHVIRRIPAADRDIASAVLESFLFGGSVHWYHPLNDPNAVSTRIPANHLFILTMCRLGRHTRSHYSIMMRIAEDLHTNSLMPFSMNSLVCIM